MSRTLLRSTWVGSVESLLTIYSPAVPEPVTSPTNGDDSDVSADEVPCTAFEQSATTSRNRLFTPPCSCPACAPVIDESEPSSASTMWLTIDGRRVRHFVSGVEFGAFGRAVLG